MMLCPPIFTTLTQGRMAKLGVASVARITAASVSEPSTRRWPRALSKGFLSMIVIRLQVLFSSFVKIQKCRVQRNAVGDTQRRAIGTPLKPSRLIHPERQSEFPGAERKIARRCDAAPGIVPRYALPSTKRQHGDDGGEHGPP